MAVGARNSVMPFVMNAYVVWLEMQAKPGCR